MTVDDVLRWAQDVQAGVPRDDRRHEYDIAKALLALFRTPMPCGWPRPRPLMLADGPHVHWASLGGAGLSADEARAMGVALILAAEGEG